MKTYAIILAAGKGSRMQSDLPKVLHRVGGVPMVEHLVSKLETLEVDEIFVVVGHRGQLVKDHLGSRVTYVEQRELLGTAHAVMQAAPLLAGKQGRTLVLTGDTPLIKTSTMRDLIRIQYDRRYSGVVLTSILDDPTGYGRILREPHSGDILGIVEEKDATAEQKRIREVNTGIFCFHNQFLFEALPYIHNHNAQQEYYLTDIIPVMRKMSCPGKPSRFVSKVLLNPAEAIGINTREQLAMAEALLDDSLAVSS